MRGFNQTRTWGLIAVALIVTLLLTFLLPSAVFAEADGPPSALNPASPASAAIANLHNVVLIIAVGVFVIVEGLLLVTAYRFRRKPRDSGEPAQIHGDNRLEIAWTVAPALLVAILFVMTINAQQTITASAQSTDGGAPLKVEVVGHQWWWEFRYPELGVTTAGEMVIPIGRLVNLEISSVDVIHSFWVPELSGKTDAVRGVTNRSWLKADRAGEFFGQCAELCGASHANMRLVVNAVSPAEFADWAAAQAAIAVAPIDPEAQAGQQVFLNAGCIACHVVRGVPSAVGKTGPDLTHVYSRPYFAGGIFATTPFNLSRWLANPPGVKPGSLMPNLNLPQTDIDALVAYLQTLK
jgi:cytochrome c oxidase subunit 2